MGSFPSFPAERTSLFHPRLAGFLFSSPPSNVRALKSAANQSFMVFWGQFDIHALLFSPQQLQGDCPQREREGVREKKKSRASCAHSFSAFSLRTNMGDVMGERRYGKSIQWRRGFFFLSFLSPLFLFCFISSCRDSEKARWVTGHEKRLLWNSCFLWAGPSYICLLFPDEISARFQWDSFSSRLIYIYSIHRTNPEVNGGDSGAGPLLY